MESVHFSLENCYGIRKMKHSFNFSESKAHLVYAPNGVMKSSFAQTLEDISLGQQPKDRIFPGRVTRFEVLVGERPIVEDEIFVIQRMKIADFKEASTILANESLKQEYDRINARLMEAKKQFLKNLQPFFGIKDSLIESELKNVYGLNFYEALQRTKIQVEKIESSLYRDIVFGRVFSDKTVKFLKSKDFKIKIEEYIKVYDDLVSSNDSLFMKGTFNPYNASSVTKSLKDNNFFSASHKVKIKNNEIDNAKELEDLIKDEKEKVLNSPELTSKFNEIDKALNSNAELRQFRAYVEENKEIIKEFTDLNGFKKKLIESYLFSNRSEYEMLLKLFDETKSRRQQIVTKAKEEQKDWSQVIDIFKRRFTIPFKVKIKNQEEVILNEEPASLIFEYSDGDGPENTKELGGVELQESLSTGEQRVFYLLNVIFQIEMRRKLKKPQLVVIDDIADSFDYKNKYAIIEYLKDVLEDPQFFMIILTHNFDFYKTIKSRFGGRVNYKGNWISRKEGNETILAKGERTDVFVSIRKKYATCEFSFIACIPFVRNLIEFSVGTDTRDYLLLTSLLHLKPEREAEKISATKDLTRGEVQAIFSKIFSVDDQIENADERVYDIVVRNAKSIVDDETASSLDIKYKLTLSIAIRIMAEEFMLSKIQDQGFLQNILRKKTGHIFEKYKKENLNNVDELSILDRVILMTAENIHVNSFMYEPLMDLSDDHLRNLYADLAKLN